jgi:hypothetical protein
MNPLADSESFAFGTLAGRSSGRTFGPMHWYAAILLPLGLVCGFRLRLLAFALLLIVPIVVAVAACDHWNRTTYSQMALDMMVAAVVLQIGYVLGVLGQIVFRHLLPDQASSSSEKH